MEDVKQPGTEPQDEKMQLHLFKARAVRQAMVEVIAEQRVEIVRRAKAKLVAMGVNVEEADLEPALS